MKSYNFIIKEGVQQNITVINIMGNTIAAVTQPAVVRVTCRKLFISNILIKHDKPLYRFYIHYNDVRGGYPLPKFGTVVHFDKNFDNYNDANKHAYELMMKLAKK